MAKTVLSGSRGVLEIEREMIAVHYLSDIDAHWTYTDAAGHRHHCEYEAADHYPTLIRVTDEAYWCGSCNDEHEEAHLACRQCAEQVVPGSTGPGVKYIPGLTVCTFNGEPVSLARAQEIAAGWQAAGNTRG
jgi:hypothetical protein